MRSKPTASYLWFFLGAGIITVCNYVYIANAAHPIDQASYLLIFSLLLAYMASAFLRARLTQYPGKEIIEHIVLIVSLCFIVLLIFTLLARPFYSRIPLLFSYLFTLGWLLSHYYLFEHNVKQRLGLIPLGQTEHLLAMPNISIHAIDSPMANLENYDAIVCDFHADLPNEWDAFITTCHIKHIPVYGSNYMSETLTGKVSLKNRSNIHFNIKTISPEYLMVKRWFDLAIILVSLPISLTILAVTALAIKLESKGNILFTQMRTGKDCVPFKIYKLRSMYTESNHQDLTIDNDVRVTKVGRFIRKTRIDELPQIWNVLKNEMSLIGPRPEYVESDDRFRQSIAYYDYRYLAKPGITGWAQVNIGHVNDEESTREKLENDIYYVKYISLWLDLHIILKTLKVVRSGQGSR